MKPSKAQEFPIGSKVTVLTAYHGNGRFAPDGCEGEWFVVGHFPESVCTSDLYIAREMGDKETWKRIVHLTRIKGALQSNWRTTEYGVES